MTSATFYAVDNSRNANSLESVVIRVFSSDGSSFITQGTTDSTGALVLELPDATYWVRFYKKGFSFASKMLVIVDGNEVNEWIVEGSDLTELPPSRADGICRVSGFVIDAQGAPSPAPILTFMVTQDKRIMGRNIIGTEKTVCQPDSSGYVEIELIQGLKYHVYTSATAEDVVTVVVPKTQSCNITDLLYPIGKAFSLVPSSVTVTVNVPIVIEVDLRASSSVSLADLDLQPHDLFVLQHSNEVSSSVTSTGITLTASSAGVYSVQLFGKTEKNYDVEGNTLLKTIGVVANEP